MRQEPLLDVRATPQSQHRACRSNVSVNEHVQLRRARQRPEQHHRVKAETGRGSALLQAQAGFWSIDIETDIQSSLSNC